MQRGWAGKSPPGPRSLTPEAAEAQGVGYADSPEELAAVSDAVEHPLGAARSKGRREKDRFPAYIAESSTNATWSRSKGMRP